MQQSVEPRHWTAPKRALRIMLPILVPLLVPASATGTEVTVDGDNKGAIISGDNNQTTITHGLPPAEVQRIVDTLVRNHQAARRVDQQTIRALQDAVSALSRRAAGPDASPAIRDALEKLRSGDRTAAETIFARVLAEKQAAGEQALREAAEAARHLGALAFLNDTETALQHYRTATRLDPDNPAGWAALGRLLNRTGAVNDAVGAYEKALAAGQKQGAHDWAAIVANDLGLILQRQGMLQAAVQMFQQALSINRSLDRQAGIAANLANLGIVYRMQRDFDRAEQMFSAALQHFTALRRIDKMAIQLGNLGAIHQLRGKPDLAEKFYQQALGAHRKLGRKSGMADQLSNLGTLRHLRGDLAKAEEFYRRALALDTELNRPHGIATGHANLGITAHAREDVATACRHWQTARTLFREIRARPDAAQVQGWIADNACPPR